MCIIISYAQGNNKCKTNIIFQTWSIRLFEWCSTAVVEVPLGTEPVARYANYLDSNEYIFTVKNFNKKKKNTWAEKSRA